MVDASGSRAAPLRQLDGLEIQETDPGEPASTSIPRLDTGGGASRGTATLTGQIATGSLTCSLWFFLAVLLSWEEVWRLWSHQGLCAIGPVIALRQQGYGKGARRNW